MPEQYRQVATAAIDALLPDSSRIVGDALCLDGVLISDLTARHGTPLYVYDALTQRALVRATLDAFRPLGARVSFAAKACAIPTVLRIFREEGLGLDAVSLGEMEAARRAGFHPSSIHLHGNCKSDEELKAALELGIHAIVIDNREEAERLANLTSRTRYGARVLIRISLPLEAETHPHLQTSGRRSKFGVYLDSEEARRTVTIVSQSPGLRLVGLHTHLGSQITDPTIYPRAAIQIFEMAARLQAAGHPIEEVSMGGGWAVSYTSDMPALTPAAVATALTPVVTSFPPVRLAVEPGRALIARAAVAVYRVGSVKWTGGRRIVAVDGGMGDNPRPALYGARYQALSAARVTEPTVGPADIVGRYCETGDMLARDVPLGNVQAGDLLVLPMSGAYQLSMASAYNLVPMPAAVLVENGQDRVITRRATVEDLLAREVVDAP